MAPNDRRGITTAGKVVVELESAYRELGHAGTVSDRFARSELLTATVPPGE